MINTVSELKDLILWAKQQKLLVLKVGEIEFHISAVSLLDSEVTAPPSQVTAVETDNKQPDDEEELLYHSAQ